MLTNQASLKRDGVQDFVSLRATALIIAAYSLFMAYVFITMDITYESWTELFSGLGMKVFTLAALVAVMIHVRIGLWQVLTDYVKCSVLRATVGYILNLIAFAYVAVGIFVMWGV